MKKQVLPTQHIPSVLSYFNANAYSPDLLAEDLAQLPDDDLRELRIEMELWIENDGVTADFLNGFTSLGFSDDRKSRLFFETIFDHIFNGKEEPEATAFL